MKPRIIKTVEMLKINILALLLYCNKLYIYICRPQKPRMKIQDKKRINAILFFAGKSPNKKINRLKLMKLLWLSDRLHLNRFGRMILRDKYYALPHGPVPSKTKDFSDTSIDDTFINEGFDIQAEDNFDKKYFSQSDIEVMNEVWQKYGLLNKFTLRDISHKFPEWVRFKDEIENPDSPNRYLMRINDFFEAPVEETDYEHDASRTELTKEIFNNHNTIQDALS